MINFRCECTYCEFCTKTAIIYDECEGCYEGKHPDLPHIKNHFEEHLITLETNGEEKS